MICKNHFPYIIKHPKDTECPLCIPEVQMAFFEHQKKLFEEQQRKFDCEYALHHDQQLLEVCLKALNEEMPKLQMINNHENHH